MDHPVFQAETLKNAPVSMKYPYPGFYYVQQLPGWAVWEWTGSTWLVPGSPIQIEQTPTVLGRVPDLPVNH